MTGPNKAIAAGLAGALTTLLVYGLTFAGINPPADVVAAAQTLIMTGLVYFVPHGGGEISGPSPPPGAPPNP